MLDTLTKGFRAARNRLAGKAEITPEIIDEALRDIRVSLLEADVSLNVVRSFVARVKEKAAGEIVTVKTTDAEGNKLKVTPHDHFIKICHDELEALMGPVDTSIALSDDPKRPTGIMMVGLQGAGKTTTTAKLANKLLKEGKKPLLVAADVYRPAAVEQLKVLGNRLSIPVFHDASKKPPEMCLSAIEEAKSSGRDVVLFDTAGRLAIDEQMMAELEAIKANVKPENIFLVADAMIGQDAVRTAAEFDRRLSISGFILTKLDGDARGGAALSIKEVTGKPIKFLGMGENLDKLEEFRPEGLAGRILGFGDIVGLVKDFEQVVDEKTAAEDAQKMLSGKFTFGDFVNQIRMIKKMGPLKDLLDKFPLFGDLGDINVDDRELIKIEAMHDSMTKFERRRADLIDDSRAARIAKGCGQKPEVVKDVIARYMMMRDVMGQIGQAPGLLNMLPGIKNLSALAQMKGGMGGGLGGLGGGLGGFGGLGSLFGGGAPDPAEMQAKMQQQMQRSIFQQQMQAQAQALGLPKGYTPTMSAANRAKAIHAGLMGGQDPMAPVDPAAQKALRDKRKKERQARKKGRKNR